MLRHARHFATQFPVLRATGRALAVSAQQQVLTKVKRPESRTETPGPILTSEVTPRPIRLIDDYLRHVGGQPTAYRGMVPPHLFPQWTFPLQMRSLEGSGYKVTEILNGGCELTINRPIPVAQPLQISVQLTKIDDNGRRAVIHQRVVTETPRAPQALVACWRGIVRLARKPRQELQGDLHVVPSAARPIDYWRLRPGIGLQFALLTGDFNPMHWLPFYARWMGFKERIVHGFSTLARTMESVIRTRANGDPTRLTTFGCRFTRPIVLPADVVVYTSADDRIFVGDAPGAPAYLTGSFALGQ